LKKGAVENAHFTTEPQRTQRAQRGERGKGGTVENGYFIRLPDQFQAFLVGKPTNLKVKWENVETFSGPNLTGSK